MKILYLTTHLNIGGISSYLFSLANGLKASGHSIYIASSGGEMTPDFTKIGVNCLEIPIRTKQELSPKILFSFLRLKNFIRDNKIEIIHSHTRVSQVLGCLLAGHFKKPHITTCHGFFKKRLSRRLFPCWGDRVIAISDAVREHLIYDFKVKAEKISLIYNGIDTERFLPIKEEEKNNAKERLGLKNNPVIGIIARLSEVKGHTYLIEAMKLIVEELPLTQLLIVGDGRIKRDLMNLAITLRLEKNVYFIPSVKDTREILAAVDIFAMPSLSEGLGLSIIEAMSCGLAVVGSNISGINGIIEADKNGLLATPKDPKDLADKIKYLLKNKDKRFSLGINARKTIEDKFPLYSMIEKTERIYQNA